MTPYCRWSVSRTALVAAFGLLVLAAAPTVLRAHDEGVVTLATRTLAAGGRVDVRGEKFGSATTLTLALVGVSGRVVLHSVRTSATGEFTAELAIPADVTPGAYRLVALAPDGDEVASLDVRVTTAPAATRSEPQEAMPPTGEPLALDRARSSWVTGGALATVAVALVLSALLLRPPRQSRPRTLGS